MIDPERLVRAYASLRPAVAPGLDGDDRDLAYDLNEAQEVFFGERNEQLLLVGSTRAKKKEILDWLAGNVGGHSTGGDNVLFLDLTLPPLQGIEIIGLLEDRLSKTSDSLYLFINEFQFLGDWHSMLKSLHDDYPRVRVAAASSLCRPVYTRLFEDRLEHCRIVVLSERSISNKKSISGGFGVHCDLKYNVKSGEVEIKGLTKAAKSRPRVDVPSEIDGRPVTIIASGAFHDRSTLLEVSLPQSIRAIGDYAFSRCTSLNRISLPKGLEHIGDNAFLGCSNLDILDGGEGLQHIGNSAFLATGWLRRQEEGMVTLGRVLYSYSGQEEVVVVPEWIDSISDYAFALNNKISEISIANPECGLGEGIAYSCASLRSFSHAARRAEIPPFSFSNCGELRSVDMTAVGAVGDYAFFNCGKLERLKIEGPLRIGHGAFQGCSSLVGLEGDCRVTAAANGAFCRAMRLEVDASFLAWATSIGHFAFHEANLRSVELKRASQIGGWAFAGCTNLQLVRMQDIESLGPSPFEGCDAISEMAIGGSRRIADFFGGHGRISRALQKLTVSGDTIAANFARNCFSIESVTVAATVLEFGQWAFYGCSGLKTVVIEDGVPEIGDWAFTHCSAMDRISLPRSIAAIGMNAFRYCLDLEEVILHVDTRLVTLGVNAFYANHEERRFLVPRAMIPKYSGEETWSEHLSAMRSLGNED